MTRTLPTALAIAALGLGAPACDDPAAPCGEPTYGGQASDEAWLTILDAYDQAALGAPEAATFTVPSPGQRLDGDPVAFTWTSPLDTARLLPGPAAPPRPGPLDRAAAALAGLFAGPAHAHLPPVTGDLHYLEVALPGDACGVRALTTDGSWLPSAADWERMRGRGELTLTLTSAYLVNNRVLEGPYRTSVRFEVR